jgi:hypothetical protein
VSTRRLINEISIKITGGNRSYIGRYFRVARKGEGNTKGEVLFRRGMCCGFDRT